MSERSWKNESGGVVQTLESSKRTPIPREDKDTRYIQEMQEACSERLGARGSRDERSKCLRKGVVLVAGRDQAVGMSSSNNGSCWWGLQEGIRGVFLVPPAS